MANLFSIPNFVKAANPKGLRRKMYLVQLKDQMQYNFFGIQQASDGSWYAWYFHSPKDGEEKIQVAKELNEKVD